ncbi:MAG TPA: hypothetical protein VFM68_03720 [Candidatus Saccharimonadales bacterium]|nr:hypothetical protein [Candidatus Saccharimonadales bacterium]
MARPQANNQEAIASALREYQLEQQYEAEEAEESEKERPADEHNEISLKFVCYDAYHDECTNETHHNLLRDNEAIDRMLMLSGIDPTDGTRFTYHQHMLALSLLDYPLSEAEWRVVQAKWNMEDESATDDELSDYTGDELASLMNHVTNT